MSNCTVVIGVPFRRYVSRFLDCQAGFQAAASRFSWTALLVLWSVACQSPERPDGPAARIEVDLLQPEVRFVDIAAEAGIAVRNVSGKADKTMIIESKGGGIGFFDYDGDGYLDLYVINGSTFEESPIRPAPSNRLYRNEGGERFTDVTEAAGVGDTSWSMGCAAADYDNDGHLDLYVTNYGVNRLYRNNGDGTFTDVTQKAGVDGAPVWSTGAAWGDYDNDGDLDLYVANYVHFDPHNLPSEQQYQTWKGLKIFHGPEAYEAVKNVLYRNNGDGTFTDVTEALLPGPARKSFQCVFIDYDNDGDLDLYVANDTDPNLLYENQGDGTFLDVSFVSGASYSEDGATQAGMGVAWGDYDGDGWFDLFVTHFSEDYNTFYRNEGKGLFSDVSFLVNVAEASMPVVSWGTAFVDYDNDGYLDLFTANGHVYPIIDQYDVGTSYPQRNFMFKNTGRGSFVELGESLGPGMVVVKVSRGAAFGDFDNDGDVDIAILNIDDTITLLRNDGGNRRPWLQVSTIGVHSNRDGIGARIAVVTGERRQLRDVMGNYSFLSQNELRVHFGLGTAEKVDLLEIRWPSGQLQQFHDLAVNQWLVVSETEGIVQSR